jgi:hypothetical protein
VKKKERINLQKGGIKKDDRKEKAKKVGPWKNDFIIFLSSCFRYLENVGKG